MRCRIVVFPIGEPHVESLDLKRGLNAFAQLANDVSDLSLFGHIQIIKVGNVAPRKDDDMAGRQGGGMRYSNHIIGNHPRIV